MDIQNVSDLVVTMASHNGLYQAIAKAERYRSGDNNLCYCRSCLFVAISEANSWLAWLDEDMERELGQPYRYALLHEKRGYRIELYTLK